MKISEYIWLEALVEKLAQKHDVATQEAEEVFVNTPYYRFAERGRRNGEDVYYALGVTDAGRYLIVYFIYKGKGQALIVSARDMTAKERKRYENR